MSLLSTIRRARDLAHKTTISLQALVTHEAWIGADQFGVAQFAEPIQRYALIDQTQREHRTGAGEVISIQAHITFLQPIEPNGATGRTEPIDANDRITLPDGTTGPIVDLSGFIDAGTNQPMLSEVWIGRGKTFV